MGQTKSKGFRDLENPHARNQVNVFFSANRGVDHKRWAFKLCRHVLDKLQYTYRNEDEFNAMDAEKKIPG